MATDLVADAGWRDLDEETKHELDEQYMRELHSWHEPELSPEAVEAYLAYRHERPGRTITTYEEGQIRKLLHRFADPAAMPDPSAEEEHLDALEKFGARKFHLTNVGTFMTVMMLFLVAGLTIWLLWGLLA